MRIMDIDKLLTVRHFAERAGVVKETILKRAKDGKLGSVRIDGRIFIIDDGKETIKKKEDI